MPYALLSIAVSFLFTMFLFQLRFMPQMTVGMWSHLWGVVSPFLMGSLFALPLMPFAPTLALVFFLTIGVGIWTAYRLYPLTIDKRLHKSRFARLDEIEPLLAKQPASDGLTLGSVKQFFFIRHYVCVRPTKEKKEIGHSLIIAPSGMGKTTMMRGQIVALDDVSMIITDPKGDLFLETAGERAQKGDVYVLDPTRGVGHCFDPLHGKTEEGDYLTVGKNVMFEPNDHDPYWTKSAAKKITYLCEAARIENIPPLLYLRCMSRLGLTQVAKRLHMLSPKLATLFLEEDYAEANLANDRTLKSVWSTLTTYLTPLLTETLVRCFTRSDFTAETMLRGERPVTLYLRLQEGHLKRLAPFVRLVIESLIREMITTWESVRGKGCRGVFFCLEEAGIMPIPDLDEWVSTGRSKGFTFQLFYQSIAQLEDNYGKEKARTIRSNMSSTVFLKPNDTEDAQRIEDKLGRGSKFAESINLREGDEFSKSLSEQGIPLMSTRELEEMNEDHAIIFHGNYPPIKAYRLKWWQSKMLKARQGLAPPVLPELPHIPDLPPSPEESQTSLQPDEFINPDTVFQTGLSRAKGNREISGFIRRAIR